jgi:hypothetical protein
VYSIRVGGNLWVEMTETVTDDSNSEEVAASLEAAVTYQCASGELFFVLALPFPICRSLLVTNLKSRFLFSGSVKASYQGKTRTQVQENKSSINFIANGGSPETAKMIAELGDKGSNSGGFAEALDTWLGTIDAKPQISDFLLRPLFEVSLILLLNWSFFQTNINGKSLASWCNLQLLPTELGDDYVNVKRNMKFAFALYSSKAIARGSGMLFFLN